MAVARMLKATVLGYRAVMDDAVAIMQRCGVVEIAEPRFELAPEEIDPDDERLRALDEQIANARFVKDHLGRYHVAEHAFSTFVAEKFHLSEDEFTALSYDDDFAHLYRETLSLADRHAAAEHERERLLQLTHDLEPWLGFRLEMNRWRGTERTALFTGTVPESEAVAIRQALRDEVAEVSVEQLGPVGDRQAWVVIVHIDHVAAVRSALAVTSFAELSFPGLNDYPAEEHARAVARIAELEAEMTTLEAEFAELAATRYHDSVTLLRALQSRRDQLVVRRGFCRTERSFVVWGWVREDRAAELEAALSPISADMDLTLEPAAEGDEPPVELDNPRWLRPFELLTDLYGRPSYFGLDPTPLLAPFFLLFFSICIGDVGYGIMLMVGCWLIKTRLDVAAGVKRFLDLIITCGAGAIVVGVFLGSYFSLPVDSLPAPLVALQIINPIEDIQTFLVAMLAIGGAQVFFGVMIAAWRAFKSNNVESAVFDQLSIVYLFAMLAVAVIAGVGGSEDVLRAALVLGIVGTMLLQGRAIQSAVRAENVPGWDRVLGLVWAAGLLGGTAGWALLGSAEAMWLAVGVCALLVVSKSVRRGVLGVLLGAYNVYGMTGFVGDVLSYLRLAALGLSSVLVGQVFNILAGLVWGAAIPLFGGGVGAIAGGVLVGAAAILIFAVGHVFNVVINLLGAFVHPARLQFVEFFSKFYEAGGRPFTPFGFVLDDLVLDAGDAGRKRGKAS